MLLQRDTRLAGLLTIGGERLRSFLGWINNFFFMKDFAVTSDARPVAAAERIVARTLVAAAKNRID